MEYISAVRNPTMANLPSASPVKQSIILHNAMVCYIGRSLDPSMPEFKQFRINAGAYLFPVDICPDKGVEDILQSLETRGRMSTGNYTALLDILENSSLIGLKTVVLQKAEEIHGAIDHEQGTYSTQPDNHSVKEREAVAKLRGKSDMFRLYCHNKTHDFVETTLYQKTRQMIEDNNSLLILGGMGDGKSSIIQYIAAHPMDEYLPISCTKAEEILKYFDLVQGTTIKLLFVFDNSFGDSYKIQRNVDEWVTLGDKLTMFLTTHKVLIATRTAIWKDCEAALKKFQIFSNVVEISSSNLTSADKRQLFGKYLKHKALYDVVVDKIVNEIKPIAFGQCCTLAQEFISKAEEEEEHEESVAEQVLQIFKKPFSFLQTELDALAENDPVKYHTLCLIMLCGGDIKCKELSGTMSENVRERMDVVVGCGCQNVTCKHRESLQKCADKLCGTYLVKREKPGKDSGSCEVYQFSHDSIGEAVIMNYGQDHFEHCLKYLDNNVVVEICRPKYYENGEQEFAICFPIEYYGEIAGIFTEKVIDANGEWGLGRVCENPCVRDEQFQSVWIDYLTQTSPQKLADFCQSKDRGDWCVLYYLAKSGADELVRYLCEHSGRKHLILTCNCRREDWLPCPIVGAVDGDHTKTFTDLLTAYTLNQDLVSQATVRHAVETACKYDSVRALKVMLPQLHEDREQTIKEGLRRACICGRVSTVRYLLSEVRTPCEADNCICVERLLAASQSGQTDTVRVILSSGHKAGINGRNDCGVSSLHVSANRLRTGVVTELVNNGADVNIADKWGLTPIHASIMSTDKLLWETDEEMRHKRRDVVETLLCHRPKVTMETDQWGRTALHLAVHRDYTDIVELFSHHGYKENTDLNRGWSEPNEQDLGDMRRAGYSWR